MALASPAHAVATWEHFGADPAYHSREAAIADAPRVLRQAGYPEPVIALLTEAMKKPGTETHVTNGMRLDFMRSGPSALWRNVAVKFEKPPRQDSMEYSAPSEEWTVQWGGTAWTAGIPKVCNNLYGKRAPAPKPQTPPPAAPPPAASAPPAAPPPTFVTGACPSGYTLIANAWSLQTLGGLRPEAEKLIQAANERDSQEATLLVAYQPPDVSRTLGKRLREVVKVRAPITADLPIRYLDPQTGKLVRDLGVMHMVRGVGSFRFSDDPRAYVVETIWPPDFVSPAMSGGERRVRMFPNEWEKFCAMNEHGIMLP